MMAIAQEPPGGLGGSWVGNELGHGSQSDVSDAAKASRAKRQRRPQQSSKHRQTRHQNNNTTPRVRDVDVE